MNRVGHLFCLLGIGFLLLLPANASAQVVPAPEDILGFKVGADYHLINYDQAIDYLKKVASVSDRIRLREMGKTTMGLLMYYAIISSADNLANLEKYQEIIKKLSLARVLSPEEARRLSAQGKAVVYIDGGLHASECAPAQHLVQLAYDLVSARDEKTLRILDEVICLLVFANPDGMNLLADWYHKNVGTPFEVSPLPYLYHYYAGHDNNRDSYLANLKETQHLSKLVNQEWYPVILYNHHQTAPFPARIWIPPNSEPTNPNVHPLIVRWQNLIGSAMGAAFDFEGKEGAISRIVFDTWYPGYVTQVMDSHNIISILTETALYRYATPRFYTVRDFPAEYQDLTMSAFYPSPWKGGWWRLRDAVDYCLTASKAVLEVAAKYRQELLYNKYKMASEVMARFQKEPPYAWIIPRDQTDPGDLAILLNRMILLGIEVYEAQEDFSCDGLSYPGGTLVIPMSQPFALFAKNMLEEQRYPDLRKYPDLWQGLVQSRKIEGSPLEAYDMMGWTLSYQFNLKIQAASSPVKAKLKLLQAVTPPAGKVWGSGSAAFLLDHRQNASFVAMNRILKQKGKIAWTRKSFTHEGQNYPEGTIIASSISRDFMEKLARDLSLKIQACGSRPNVETLEVKLPRLGIYQSWVAVEDEGWTRFILDEHEFSYRSLHDADIKAGNLASQYDTIIIPDHYSPELLLNGYHKGDMPPDYVGGLTERGVNNLKQFVKEGGTLVFLNSSCNLATSQLKPAVRNVLEKAKRDEFNCSGSILLAEFDRTHPVAYGMDSQQPVVFAESCAFDVFPSFDQKNSPRIVAKYAGDNLLLSGWIYGEKLIQQKAAIVEIPLEEGRLVLLGFPVQFRAQPRGTFKLLFNSIFYGTTK
ncbi:MAG: M14 family metallopeptidase [Candidatus Saccharicenans sp.]|uniref:M14 family metallopeptidase n=1 Tax=Candidatus Saccharicenans sp. TaxID=2819258 RepID=UPI0040495135